MPARSVLMIRPHGFAPDHETAADNAFQHAGEGDDPAVIQKAASDEFLKVTEALEANGVQVSIIDGKADLPDDVFPNNWFSTFEDGTQVLYPMKALSRRMERRQDIVDWLMATYPQLVDLSGWEDRDMFLEGTGSLVLDRENLLAFAARSERTNEQLVRNWCSDFEYEPVLFDTTGPGGKPIYHTNVMLSIGSGYAVVCLECVDQAAHLLSALLTTGREVIEITRGQMMNFCGNVLELQGKDKVLVMSSTARAAFSAAQIEKLERFVKPIIVDIPTIEKYGGGGIRCMIAELY